MKRAEIILAISLLVGGCTPSSQPKSLTGMVTDATMNTVTIVNAEKDTLHFSTANADRTEVERLQIGDSLQVFYSGRYKSGMEATKMVSKPRLLGGDRDEHGCIASAGYTWSEVLNDCIRLFEKGIRTEALDGTPRCIYVVFSADSSKAELFSSDVDVKEILERRTLPTGESVWNVEDDDTKNLQYKEGRWTISQRGKLIYEQRRSDNDSSLGEWKELHYAGTLPAADCSGIEYRLDIRHRTHSGDGSFHLTLTYLGADNGRDATFSYTGKRYTLRGTPDNENATVWQCVPDRKKQIFNFLYEDEQTLTLLNNQFEKAQSDLNYSLKRIE